MEIPAVASGLVPDVAANHTPDPAIPGQIEVALSVSGSFSSSVRPSDQAFMAV